MRNRVYVNNVGPWLLLDVQADLLEHLSTRAVVPLIKVKDAPPIQVRRLNPVFEIVGERYVMMTHYITAVPRGDLGAQFASLEAQWAEITAALDVLLTGV